MKRIALCLAIAGFASGCVEDTGSSSGVSDRGTGNDSKVGVVTATMSLRNDGSQLFLLTRGAAVCTAVFDDAPAAGKSELSPIRCSDGNNGNATVVYNQYASADRVVYNAGLDGGGTVRF